MRIKRIVLAMICFLYYPTGFARQTDAVFNGDGYAVTICDKNYVGRAIKCNLSGSGHFLRVKGTIVSGNHILVGGEMLIQSDGRIINVGCRIQKNQSVTLDCPGALISPGFINLHEHIEYSYQRPNYPPKAHWNDRDEWRAASAKERGFLDEKPTDDTQVEDVSERAMLRHLLSGTTSVAGAKQVRAYTRNLGIVYGTLGSPANTPVDSDTFPIKHSNLATKPCQKNSEAGVQFNPSNAYVAHVGEGIDQHAHCEIDVMLAALQDKKTPNAFIHGVALDQTQINRLKKQNISIVLSPRSNFELYGVTSPIPQLKHSGINMALSTDWSVSGSLTMSDEMRCLAHYNQHYLNHVLSWAEIHQMATRNAARAVGLDDKIGELVPGKLADFIVIDTESKRSFGEVLNQTAYAQITAVFISGKGVNFPASWKSKLPFVLENCAIDPRNLCGQSRIICGANDAHSLLSILASKTYRIDDSILCYPESPVVCTPSNPSQFTGFISGTGNQH